MRNATVPSEVIFPLEDKRVWVAGHGGMVGAAILRRLAQEKCHILVSDRKLLDLRNQSAVNDWVEQKKPDAIFIAAARVGGILANESYPAEFLYDNLMIEANIVNAAWQHGVSKLLLLGSSCIYPRLASQPIREDALLTGPLEKTNEWYAVAKIAGIKLCQAYRRQFGADFISAMPTNLYGPGDRFDLNTSHVIPALIRKAHDCKINGAGQLTIWGTGTPRREFLYVDDCADACVHLMKVYSDASHINVGSGVELTIFELARLISRIVGFNGEIVTDTSKPDGTPRKLLDNGRVQELGWRPHTGLQEGISKAYQWFLGTSANDVSNER